MPTFEEYLDLTWDKYLEGGPDIYSDGLFMCALRTTYSSFFPWLDEPSALSIDIEWSRGRSAHKRLSTLVARMEVDGEDPVMGDIDSSPLTKIIKNRFGEKWNRTYDALFADYNPIENYNMVEEENVGTDMKTHTYEGDGASNETENKIFGFNSDTAVPFGKSEVKSAMQTEGDYDSNHRKLTRAGNIGVTLTQRMIQAELDIRRNQFFEIVMSDLDSLLCQRAY